MTDFFTNRMEAIRSFSETRAPFREETHLQFSLRRIHKLSIDCRNKSDNEAHIFHGNSPSSL